MQNVKDRWGNGSTYRSSKHIYNAIKKYGWDNFNHFIIAENLTSEEADSLETKLISKYNTTEEGYNIAKGGVGCMHNRNHSEETKAILSKKKKATSFFKRIKLEKDKLNVWV